MMIDFLMAALLGDPTQTVHTMAQFEAPALPGIEIMEPARIPKAKTIQPIRYINNNPSTSLLVLDSKSGQRLFEQASYKPQHIASVTKLMTVLIVLEENGLDEIVQVTPKATNSEGVRIGLLAYEEITVETLLQASLIPSANDAAVALAIHNAGSEEAFVKKMNKRAKELGIGSANFVNATGLDMEIPTPIANTDRIEMRWTGNTMSATDVALLAKKVLQNDFVRKTVAQKSFFGTSIDGRFSHEKQSTNKLLWSDLGVRGLKTGYTNLAGECLVTLSTNEAGEEIIVVILGSDARFEETEKVLKWALEAWDI